MLSNQKIANISKYIFILLMFGLPLSIEKEFLHSGTKLLWFTEPLCALLCVLIAIYIYQNRKEKLELSIIDKLTLVFLSSVITSTLLSDDYFVSIKFSISLFWYFTAGYLVIRLFKFSAFQIRLSVFAYLIGVFVLCLFVLNNFRKLGIFYESSYLVSAPFIKEGHTDMSVVIEPALLLSSLLFLVIPLKNNSNFRRMIVLSTTFLAVIMFSCSKASYAALLISFMTFAVILFLRKPRYILNMAYFVVPFLILVGIWQWNDYRHKKNVAELENSYYSSGSDHYDPTDRTTYKATNMFDELFNQSTDTDKNDSNKERINRWKTGIELFVLNPAFGIGMGTFPDKYLDEQTLGNQEIDENYLTQNRMNLHNIFLGWLVEGGILTFLAGLALILVFFAWLIKEMKVGKYSFLKILLVLYMITFIFHGFFHDFTQNARIIIPFWICLALVSRQMIQNKKSKIDNSIANNSFT